MLKILLPLTLLSVYALADNLIILLPHHAYANLLIRLVFILALWIFMTITIKRLFSSLKQRNLFLATTFKLPVNEKNDELKELNQLLDALPTTTIKVFQAVSESSNQAAYFSDELYGNARNRSQFAKQIAEAINHVVDGTETQKRAVAEVSLAVEGVSASIQLIATNTGDIQMRAQRTTDTTKLGKTKVGDAIKQINEIENETSAVQLAIGKVSNSSGKVSEIVGLITDIASQTNLLALNAAIEAARAGEQGRGFAVVAEEVRKLAEQSRQATAEISKLIVDNDMNILHAVSAMNEVSKSVEMGIQVVNEASQTFDQISSLIFEVSGQIEDTAAAVEEVASSSEEILASMQEIENISIETAEKSVVVQNASVQQTSIGKIIAGNLENLAKIIQSLKVTASNFD
ncbi:exported hypothetical protein [Candidatus Desulfosporosinus infrequens]|uniref:Methyl-accepting transducer domain-containing protein n=1 Tax=Candidatus Desulfosporosinus infrequens TaxID=2043169 RepID=A0A2U3K4G5_9FIRM|nr:exported hypothetical protein [Candidatus Desulfosporosinus infrequens]